MRGASRGGGARGQEEDSAADDERAQRRRTPRSCGAGSARPAARVSRSGMHEAEADATTPAAVARATQEAADREH